MYSSFTECLLLIWVLIFTIWYFSDTYIWFLYLYLILDIYYLDSLFLYIDFGTHIELKQLVCIGSIMHLILYTYTYIYHN